jgi:hypothetical protein
MIDLEARVRHTLVAVATGTDIPPLPSPDQPTIVDPVVGRARRRQLARTAAVTAVVVPAIVGLAAAGGLLPGTFIDRLNWVPERSGPIVDASVEWGGSIDGPPGRRFEVWVATGENGEVCTTRVFVDDTVAVGATPAGIEDEGGRCSPGGTGHVFANGCGVGGSDGIYSYGCEAGPVTRAELHLADGTVMPTVIAGGEVSGWFPWTPGTPGPALLGYLGDGTPVDQFTIDPPWCASGPNRCSGEP